MGEGSSQISRQDTLITHLTISFPIQVKDSLFIQMSNELHLHNTQENIFLFTSKSQASSQVHFHIFQNMSLSVYTKYEK